MEAFQWLMIVAFKLPRNLVKYLTVKSLNISSKQIKLGQSGYRKYSFSKYELLTDVGELGPSYQPGHAHADTFSFILQLNEKPFIVDPGVSTYNMGDIRERERSTAYHNTVSISNRNSSEVWAGFRVANRAKVTVIHEESNFIKASHNGYKKVGYTHTRSFLMNDKIYPYNRRTVFYKKGPFRSIFTLTPKCNQTTNTGQFYTFFFKQY